MKIFKPFLISFVFLAALFVSCKKETSFERPGNLPDVTVNLSDSNYLDKYYYLNDQGTGLDTQEVTTFKYDNLKRVTGIFDSCLNCSALPDLLESFHFIYNGNDTIPYKTFYEYHEQGYYDSLTTYHYYDNSHNKIKDSSVRAVLSSQGYSSYRIIDTYSYAPGKIYHYQEINQVAPLTAASQMRDTADVDALGNVIHNKRYFYNGISYNLEYASDLTYDTKKSPFAKLSFFKSRSGLPSGETLFFQTLGYNNRLSQSEYSQGLLTVSVNYLYIYNTAGYPVRIDDDFSSLTERYLFKYKSL